MSIVQLAIIFFIVTNPVGNSPAIIALIKDHSIREQQKILFRETIFSLILAIFFLFLGETLLDNLSIQNFSLNIGGGIILFLVALKMIFSLKDERQSKPKQEPFIVPIATPILSGTGLLTMIILYSKQEGDNIKLLLAILLAWIAVGATLISAPYLQFFLGKRGLAALEQLMGMLLTIMAVEMILQGFSLFLIPLIPI